MIELLGWMLVHAAWQGGVIVLVVAAALELARRARPSIRYAIALAGLASMIAIPIATAILMMPRHELATASASPRVPSLPWSSIGWSATPAPASSVTAPAAGPLAEPWTIERVFPWLVAAWLVGVVVLSLRMLAGITEVRRLAARGTSDVDERIAQIARSVARRLGVSRAVRVLRSVDVDVPMVVGWVKPIILLPVSLATGATPAQLEMIIAHELAHIRRHDTIVNLAQRVVEVLLFYHPAAWWLSARVREERENCSDDLALSVCGADRRAYAAMLLMLEESREVALATAATDGSLIRRVRRIVRTTPPRAELGGTWLAGAATLIVAMTVMAPDGIPAAEVPTQKPSASSPVRKANVVPLRPAARQARPDFAGSWAFVADYSTTPAVAGFNSSMTIEQRPSEIVVTSDSADTRLRLSFTLDSITASSAYLTGPVAIEYSRAGFVLKMDTSLNTSGLRTNIDGVGWTVGVGVPPGSRREQMILASVKLSLDKSGMLIVEARVPQDQTDMPKSTFQRFRRLKSGNAAAAERSSESAMTAAQTDSMHRLALAMALSMGFNSRSRTIDPGSPEVSAQMPYAGIVLIDGQRATLATMRALRREDVRRYSYLVGKVAPQYFADPGADKGVIAFETGQLRRQ